MTRDKSMKLRLLIILPLLLLITFCEGDGKIWMSIDPVQCLGNDWELDWLSKNNNNFDLWAQMTEEEQLQVFKEYFENRGVVIHDMDVTQPYEEVCLECDCPRGDRIHVLVDDAHLNQLLSWGFVLD